MLNDLFGGILALGHADVGLWSRPIFSLQIWPDKSRARQIISGLILKRAPCLPDEILTPHRIGGLINQGRAD